MNAASAARQPAGVRSTETTADRDESRLSQGDAGPSREARRRAVEWTVAMPVSIFLIAFNSAKCRC